MRSNLWSGRDDGAGDSRAGIPGSLGQLVVGAGMDHERKTGPHKRRHTLAGHRPGDGDLAITVPILSDGDVAEIADVRTVGILPPMLPAGRVIVAPRRLKVGWVALGVLVKMDAVNAGR